jgi:osomolarity two-component system sensor histidine kinase SLN1
MKLWKRRTFKIGLRVQLMILIIFVALASLIILAITTGIYFTTNYREAREERLQTIAQLKASQVEQSLNILYYQAYWLTISDSIPSSLVSYRAGNNSESNWADAKVTIQQFLQSTLTYASVRMYDTKFKLVVKSQANWSDVYVPDDVLESLFPLQMDNVSIPSSVETQGMVTGPVRNGSSTTEVLSMTLPVFYTSSILSNTPDLVGYVTTVMSASVFDSVITDNTTDTYAVVLAADVNDGPITMNSTFSVVFDRYGISDGPERIGSSEIAIQALKNKQTGTKRTGKNRNMIVISYCHVNASAVDWAAVVIQDQSTFDRPSTKLQQLLIGVSVGIAVFMAIITFPLTYWAVHPILQLQKAAELIATGRGLQPPNRHKKDPSLGNASISSSLRTGFSRYIPSLSPGPRGSSGSGSGTNTGNGGERPLSDIGSLSSGMNESSVGVSYLHNARIPTYKRIFEDELSKLTATFNAMTDELDSQYTTLEERVKARTKQLEAAKIQAEAANDAKTVFIANISHELRTPLNGILGMTAIAMAETDISKIQQSMKLIFRSGELLLHIMTELLTFSKNSLKRSKLENADFCILEVALQIKSIFGKLAKDQNVHLSITLSPNEMRKMVLYGDSNRIIQIVMNLVSNSLKFTPVDGKVKVMIRNLGEYDEEKSRSEDYKKVYVKSEIVLPITEKIEQSSQQDISLSDETSPATTDDDDDIDSKSIMTVSTSSYDDNIFKTQFKLADPDGEEEKIKTKPINPEKTWVFEFVVEDTGPGIDKKLQKAVFEPFVQGDQTLSRQYGGTGLGLSICSQLASMMHGTMELESTVGVGSKFTFRVPLLQRKIMIVEENDALYEDEFNLNSKKNRRVRIVEAKRSGSFKDVQSQDVQSQDVQSLGVQSQADAEVFTPSSEKVAYFDKSYVNSTGTAKSTSSQSSTAEINHNAKKLKILIAEDNNVNQEVIKRMLSLEGYTDISLARDGEEAIQLMKSNLESESQPYSIVFMDVQMPKVDGHMATKTIREELGYTGPIVALTAFADESNVKECLESGMIGFLSKPIRRTQLRQVLEKYCGATPKKTIPKPPADTKTENDDDKK